MPRPEALACLRVALPNLHIRIAITNEFFSAALAGFALLTITDPAMFSVRRSPPPSHPDRRSAMSLRGRALTDADDAQHPLPSLLPDHPAWEGEVVEAVVAVRGVDLD